NRGPADPGSWSGRARRTLAPGRCPRDAALGGRQRCWHHGTPHHGRCGPMASLPLTHFFCPCLTFRPLARLYTGAVEAPSEGPGPAVLSHILLLGTKSKNRLPTMQWLTDAQGRAREPWTRGV